MAERSVLLSIRGVSKRFDHKPVLREVCLEVGDGEFVTLLGPSGCGKTTLLRLIAGFDHPDGGDIHLDGAPLTDLPPDRRPVNTVFQNYALFPHMTVFDNVAYGLRMEERPRDEIRQRVEEVLAAVQLADLALRRPAQLSGGQQQRVAVARAVVKRPRVLLLDEPLSALDFKLRKQMQMELKRLQRELGITFLLVTHDQEEALSMSDRVVVLDRGEVAQVGTPRELYERPASLFVARFVGDANILPAIVVRPEGEKTIAVTVAGKTLEARRPSFPVSAGQPLGLLLRPEDMRLLAPDDPGFGFPGRVMERAYKGSTLDSLVQLDGGAVLHASEFFDEDYPDFDHDLGEPVKVSWVPGWEWLLPDAEDAV